MRGFDAKESIEGYSKTLKGAVCAESEAVFEDIDSATARVDAVCDTAASGSSNATDDATDVAAGDTTGIANGDAMDVYDTVSVVDVDRAIDFDVATTGVADAVDDAESIGVDAAVA